VKELKEILTCDQCGRVGVRGFTVYPGMPDRGVPGFVQCTARKTCLRRCYRRIPADVRARDRWLDL
jgi:hypothetical protein